MRVLVSGDRNWADATLVDKELSSLPVDVVIHGGCTGADQLAGQWAFDHHVGVQMYPAEWRKYGKRAGPVRNQRMINEGWPDCALLFHDNMAKSRGTKDMLRRVIKHGLPYKIVSHQHSS